jgi:TIR domain
MSPQVFLSYSRADNRQGDVDKIKQIVERIYDAVTGNILDIYLDTKGTDAGLLTRDIKQKIEKSNVFLAVLSDNYADASGTASAEFRHALACRESHGTTPEIVPLNLRSIKNNAPFLKDTQAFITYDFSNIFLSSEQSRIEHEAVRLVGAIVNSQSGSVFIDDKPSIDEDTRSLIDEIGGLISNLPPRQPFQYELIQNILKDVRSEIKSIPNMTYNHDISLGRSFVIRAAAIFRPAKQVWAVSLDSASSFWLSENTKKLALEYTEVQPKTTYRLFVFSSPMALLAHRWVLCEHFRQYGGNGRVLMTSRDHWKSYLEDNCHGEDFVPSLSEDFGILYYKLNDTPLMARLSRENLSFEECASMEFARTIERDFAGDITTDAHSDGDTHVIRTTNDQRSFWVWRHEYGNMSNSTPWHRCVSDMFDEDVDFSPTYNSSVMHKVFFAPDSARLASRPLESRAHGDFQEFMKKVINDLLKLESSKNEKLVQSIWFGLAVPEADVEANDPIHQNRLLIDPSVWKYCLSMSFRNQAELKEFYENTQHSKIRRRIYEFLDPSVAALYSTIAKPPDPDSRVGEAIERIMRRYMVRMDYIVPNPYVVYDAINAPSFGP